MADAAVQQPSSVICRSVGRLLIPVSDGRRPDPATRFEPPKRAALLSTGAFYRGLGELIVALRTDVRKTSASGWLTVICLPAAGRKPYPVRGCLAAITLPTVFRHVRGMRSSWKTPNVPIRLFVSKQREQVMGRPDCCRVNRVPYQLDAITLKIGNVAPTWS